MLASAAVPTLKRRGRMGSWPVSERRSSASGAQPAACQSPASTVAASLISDRRVAGKPGEPQPKARRAKEDLPKRGEVSLHPEAAAHRDGLTGDRGGGVRGKEEHRFGDLRR